MSSSSGSGSGSGSSSRIGIFCLHLIAPKSTELGEKIPC